MDTAVKRVLGAAVAVTVAVAVAAGPARADGDEREVARLIAKGQKKFQQLEYQEAIRTLAPIPHEPNATRAQKIDALELIAISHVILGDEVSARQAFEALLTIDPDHELRFDDGSPKIESIYTKVKQSFVPGAAEVQVEHSAPKNATAGAKIDLEARILAGEDKAKQVVVRWRLQGSHAYREAAMRNRSGALWRTAIDAPGATSNYVIDYYIEVRGIAGNTITHVGGPEMPLGLSVSPGRAPAAWYARWYVIAGGAAAITLGAVLVLSTGDSAETGTLDPGRVTLTP